MRKIILFFLLIFVYNNTFAHPIDISKSTVGIKDKQINITTYFHTYEINYLLKTKNIKINSVEGYFDNTNIIKDYIINNIKYESKINKCKLVDFEFFKEEIYTILSDGLKVSYKILCNEQINDIKLEVNYFSNFPLQTNRVNVYNLNNGVDSILYKVLTPRINYIEIKDLKNFKIEKKLDRDCEGLGDEDEKIYKTDPLKIDTDGDNYTDFEEVTGGWNPIDPEYGPGQEYRDIKPIVTCKKEQVEFNEIEIKKIKSLDSSGYGNESLKDILKYISNYINKNEGNFLYIFLIVYLLGLIHSIGPGHSKTLLVAYTLEKNNGYKKGILFALIFSFSHVLDILILFGITTLLFQFVDVSKFNYYIQAVSVIILFLFSVHLVYMAFYKKRCCKHNDKKEKRTLLIAFLAGLAPCSFAWSIYFLLLSLGKLSFVFPLIGALGLGIFSTLVGVVIITVLIKEKSLNKTKKFAKYSTKISAIIILIISITLIYKTINI